jgi:tight adherence protein C
MQIIVATLAFVATSLVVWELFRPKENVVARRIRPVPHGGATVEMALDQSPMRRLAGPFVLRAGWLLTRILPQTLLRHVSSLLVQANSGQPLPLFMAYWAASVLVGGLFISHFVQSNANMSMILRLVGLMGAAIAFGLGPYLLLRRRARARQRAITRSLPYALDLLVTCVEAGLGVDAAIAVVADKTVGPLSELLSRYLWQVGLGRPRRDALTEVANRSGVSDLIRLAAAVAQAEEVGTTIGDVLRVQAGDLRLSRTQRAQEAAQRAPALMSIPLSTCFMPAMVAVIVVPSMMSLGQFIGQLGSGVVGQ